MTSDPKDVAKFLGLPNAENYTGHCLRRTGATLLAVSGISKNPTQKSGKMEIRHCM
jgi:hypothetical protein